ELLAFERERQMAFGVAFVRVASRLPTAAIPDHDRAATVLTLGDRALERVVFDRMILDMDGQPLLTRHQARSAGDGPAFHHAVELQAQIVVQAASGMLLDDIAAARGA